MDHVVANASSCQCEAQLYIFEDNEAVIKMIIKGRSPMMRHVSRTHRVVSEWLFDRINLTLKIQIKYVDTENQLADMLTKGSFTRDEWNHLLRLFNSFFFEQKGKPMSMRAQERKIEEELAAANLRSACLVSRNLLRTRQSYSLDSGASCGPGNQELDRNSVSGSTGKPAPDRVQNPATNSQEWRKDDHPFLDSKETCAEWCV